MWRCHRDSGRLDRPCRRVVSAARAYRVVRLQCSPSRSLESLGELATVTAAFLTRVVVTGFPYLARHLPERIAMAPGGVIGAWAATGLLMKVKDRALERIVGVPLLGVAVLFVAEAIVPQASSSAFLQSPWLG